MRNDKEASACPQAALLLREEGEGEVTRGEETMGNACPQAALKLAETFANVVYIHVSKFMDMYANVMWKLMYRNCCRRTIY
jgi:hypothetical protein